MSSDKVIRPQSAPALLRNEEPGLIVQKTHEECRELYDLAYMTLHDQHVAAGLPSATLGRLCRGRQALLAEAGRPHQASALQRACRARNGSALRTSSTALTRLGQSEGGQWDNLRGYHTWGLDVVETCCGSVLGRVRLV